MLFLSFNILIFNIVNRGPLIGVARGPCGDPSGITDFYCYTQFNRSRAQSGSPTVNTECIHEISIYYFKNFCSERWELSSSALQFLQNRV